MAMAYVFEALPADRSRIEMADPREVRYWAAKFGCSEDHLRKVVAQVGPSAAQVERVIDGCDDLLQL
jgi:hypothetical protein